MPTYQVSTNRGDFEIESDREPTSQDVEAYLSKNKPEEGFLSKLVKGASGNRVSGIPNTAIRTPSGGLFIEPPSGKAVDIALEAGLPMAGQALTAEGAPLGITSAVGGGLSALGNTLAQLRRMATGEQEDFSKGQLAEATALGAVPFVGPAKTASKLMSAARTAANVGIAATAGVAGEQLRKGIDEGKLLTSEEAAGSALVPAAIVAGLGPIGLIGRKMVETGQKVGENLGVYKTAGITPTPGMLLPEQLASTESKIGRSEPTGKVAKTVDEAYNQIGEGLTNVSPNPKEPAAIFSEVSPLLGKVDSAKEQLAKLDATAQKARETADLAVDRLSNLEATADQEVKKAAYKAAETASAEAFSADLKSVLKNAQDLATEQISQGRTGFDPSTARSLFVEHVTKPLTAAFDEQATRMYAGVDNQTPLFDTSPILAKAREAGKLISGTKELPPKLASALDVVSQNLGEGTVSLQALRNVRDDLLRRVRMQSYETPAEERMIKGVAHSITEQIEEQAPKVMGKEMGEQLLRANKFYREKSQLFDQPGIELLFSDNPNDDTVRKVVMGMEKSGINSDEYKNLKNLIVKTNEFDPGLSAALKGQANAIIRGAVLHDASTIASESGELIVDGAQLVKNLEKLGKVDGTLEALGLGDRKKVAELKTLFDKYDAAKMTEGEWETLFKSPAFRTASAGKLATELKPALAAAQAESLLMRSAQLRTAGKIDLANQRYGEALKTLEEVGGDLLKARNLYDSLLNDPVAMAFNNPNLGNSDFNSFAKSLFDAKAGKLANKDVSEMVTALRESPDEAHKALLLRLQERYIADRMATFRNSASPESLKRPDTESLANFFNPANPTDAANELDRAKAILEPGQFKKLEEFSKVARNITRYEKLGASPQYAASHDIPAYQIVRRTIDAIGDLWRSGKYALAARRLAEPEAFAAKSTARGQVLETVAGQAGKTGALLVPSEEKEADRRKALRASLETVTSE